MNSAPTAVATAAIFVWLGMVLAIRPQLNRRTDRVLAGQPASRSSAHLCYVGLEAAKVLMLTALGICLLVAQIAGSGFDEAGPDRVAGQVEAVAKA